MFKPIEKDSVPLQIVNYFLDSISSGDLHNEAQIPPERTLCEKFGVGRSTLREALRILEMMGVVEKRSDGTYIHLQTNNIIKEAIAIDFAVGVTNYSELIELRNFLEVESIISAAKNRTDEDLAILEDLCDKAKDKLKDVQSYAEYGTEFHLAVARSTHNEVFSEIFEAIRLLMFDYQKNNMRNNDEIYKSYYDHLRLVRAIAEQNVESAEAIMREHLDYTKELYERRSMYILE